MAVHIRLARAGAKKRPFYRIVVTDHRSPRGGRFLENIGTYDPAKDPGLFALDRARFEFWTRPGATPRRRSTASSSAAQKLSRRSPRSDRRA